MAARTPVGLRVARRIKGLWIRFWMKYAGFHYFGRIATRLATAAAPPFTGRIYLAGLNTRGYISPSAAIYHADVKLGRNVFVGDRVVLFQDHQGGPVELGDRVHLMDDTYIDTGSGGSLKIGATTSIQQRCQLSAHLAPIEIGCGVQVGPHCAFYSYDHGMAPGDLIMRQPCQTKGGIVVGDDAWLGFGVIVLNCVRIGKGAVIGAGSVVTHDIPDGAIAVGVPARVIKMRGDLAMTTSTLVHQTQ